MIGIHILQMNCRLCCALVSLVTAANPLLGASPSAGAVPHVALINFSTDDNSYRSAQMATDFTSLLQIRLANEPNVVWIERDQLDKARQELELSAMELVGGGSSVQRGKWVKADWMITGQFSLDDRDRRTLFLEITDLQHADVLASQTLTFPDTGTSQAAPVGDQVELVSKSVRQLLQQARLRQHQMAGKILMAPLFLADVSRFRPSRGAGPWWQWLDDALEQEVATNRGIQLIRFPKAYRSLEESEMVLDGLVEADRNAWQQTADLYVWGTYFKTNDMVVKGRGQKLRVDLFVWDVVSRPVVFNEEIECSLSGDVVPAQAEAAVKRLVGQIVKHARKRDAQTDSGSIRREVAKSLVQAYDRMTQLRVGGHRDELGFSDPEKFTQAVHLLETACFFDPDNAETRALYISCRWGFWINFNSEVRSQFWSKWRRSQAWGKYVNRFGLGPISVQLSFPYQQHGGVPAAYVESLDEALKMFPEWHSVEEMELEDQWKRQGTHTWLMEAEYHGFPKEMPHELAMKWKLETVAELAVRRKKVEEFARSSVTRTNHPGTVPNRQSEIPNPANPNSIPIQRPSVPPQIGLEGQPAVKASLQSVAKPAWFKDLNAASSMFQLSPPSVLPFEVRPARSVISFPTQFAVKSVIQVGCRQDRLFVLATDTHSVQSSDANTDPSAERLDEHNQLWVVEQGARSPVLFEPEILPQSVNGFLLEGDHLWVAGDTTGFVDLKAGTFRKFGLTDGYSLQTAAALGSAGRHIFAAGDRPKLSVLKDGGARWENLPLPRVTLSSGTGHPSLLAGSQDWLIYVAGSVLFYNCSAATWTNASNLSVRCVSPDGAGFWLGGELGLYFYDFGKGALKTWLRPKGGAGGLGLPIMGYAPLNMNGSSLTQDSIDQLDRQLRSGLKKVQEEHERIHQSKTNQSKPFQLEWRVPGEIAALADDGEFLWIATDNSAANLMLLHKPSLSLVGCCNTEGNISHLAVSAKDVWVAAAFGERLLTRIPKEAFLSVPKSSWSSLAISADEQDRLINGMSLLARAKYAFYSGDDAKVADLLEGVNPVKATLEEMFLLAFSYDAVGLDRPERMRYWLDSIISRHPDSPWARAASDALRDNEPKHAAREYEESLLTEYDRNRDGQLEANEKELMEKDPAYKEKARRFMTAQLGFQLREVVLKFDKDGNDRLDLDELKTLEKSVRLYLQVQPEVLANRKAVVAPLLSDRFPPAATIIKKYDANGDSTLSANELKCLAEDLQPAR